MTGAVPSPGLAQGRTLAGVGLPAAITAYADVPVTPSGRNDTWMAPGGVPAAPELSARQRAVAVSPEATPIGPAMAARRDSPLTLSGGWGAEPEPAYGGGESWSSEAAATEPDPPPGHAVPTGRAPSARPPSLRDLSAARDTILEGRARARERDAEFGHSYERSSADYRRGSTSRPDEDEFHTELMRRREQRGNLALIGAAGILGIGLALGGYFLGRGGNGDDHAAGSEDRDALRGPADTDDDTDTDRASDVVAPIEDLAAPTAAPDNGGTAAPVDGAGAGAGVHAPGSAGSHAAGALRPRPGSGSKSAPGVAGAGVAPPEDYHPGGAAGTAAGAGHSGSSPPPGTAAAGPSTDLDTYDRYAAGAADHDPVVGHPEIDEEGIALVVRHHLPKVRACYERRFKTNPALFGRVEVQFTIGADGGVPDAFVLRDTTGDPAVGACIVAEMRSWHFPKPLDGAVNLIYPFVFPKK